MHLSKERKREDKFYRVLQRRR